jgi:hypothetical protein
MEIYRSSISYGEFTEAEREFFAKFEDTNEFLHGRGKLVDDIWKKFVVGLFDGQPEPEWSLLEAFITNILKVLPDKLVPKKEYSLNFRLFDFVI